MLRTHLNGVLAWTRIRVTNGALEGMNNKVKVISHGAYGYRTSWAYIANIYHCCAGYRCRDTFGRGAEKSNCLTLSE